MSEMTKMRNFRRWSQCMRYWRCKPKTAVTCFFLWYQAKTRHASSIDPALSSLQILCSDSSVTSEGSLVSLGVVVFFNSFSLLLMHYCFWWRNWNRMSCRWLLILVVDDSMTFKTSDIKFLLIVRFVTHLLLVLRHGHMCYVISSWRQTRATLRSFTTNRYKFWSVALFHTYWFSFLDLQKT